MLGYPFRPLLQAVQTKGGLAAVAEVRRRARVPPERTYRMAETYEDEECRRLLAAAGEVLALRVEETCEVWADAFLKDTQKRFPAWYRMCTD